MKKTHRRHWWRMAPWGVAVFILLLPWGAMQFTNEVVWDGADFAMMGMMLLAACGAYELTWRGTRNNFLRVAIGVTIVAVFLLTWVQLAVGLIGAE